MADVTPQPRTTAVGYLRLSQDRTGQEAGVTRQREDVERRARERGWTLCVVESDNDVSAAGKRKRPGFEAMLLRIKSGEAQVVIAWSLDRLQRNRRDEVRLYELCQAKGVTISLVHGADLDFSTAGGRLVADQLSSVARYEIDLKADRTRRAQEQAAKDGRRVGGRRPFGYESDGVTIRESEAEAIRDGARAVLAGEPIAEVAREWNRRKLTTGQCGWKGDRQGKPSPFTRSSVRDVLMNPRHAGLRYYKGERVADAKWPAIIDEETWRAVCDVLTDPGRRTAPANAQAMLTGVALCGVCGQSVHSGGASKGSAGRVYRCRSMKHCSRSALPVDEYVRDVVLERMSRPDAVALLSNNTRPDARKLRERAVALRARLDGLAAEFADADPEDPEAMTPREFRVAGDKLRQRLAEVEAQLADAGRGDVLGSLVHADDAARTWEDMSEARRRAIVDLLMTVTIHPPGKGVRTFRPESVGIEWKTDQEPEL